ncbi:hypothetical protein EYF80_000229 [Liparis tanakae]|uniref:Uncharacterized protein n=1 Tax=Liparis tanakae TaxID=230148 RepID=A0A4Z2JH51_9TELE|nr:hypothetical protein EYF80_000229 [Liparis tanakae]
MSYTHLHTCSHFPNQLMSSYTHLHTCSHFPNHPRRSNRTSLLQLRTDGQKQIFQASGCFPLDALLHLVSSQLHVGIKH